MPSIARRATEGYTAQNRGKTCSTHTFHAASPTRNSVILAVPQICKPALLSVDFFLLAKNERSGTERAKDALQSLGDGGLYGTEQEKNMFYTYILRSISHPEQRYIGSTSDLKSRLAKHNAGEFCTRLLK